MDKQLLKILLMGFELVAKLLKDEKKGGKCTDD